MLVTSGFCIASPFLLFPLHIHFSVTSHIAAEQSGALLIDKLGFFVTKQFSHCICFTQQTAGQARDGESFGHSLSVLYSALYQFTEAEIIIIFMNKHTVCCVAC